MLVAGHAVYDRIGAGYVAGRREDPRIARAILRALGDARTVVNVGAGAGSDEPADRDLTAVEPSEVMLAQRPAGAAHAVRAFAETLPFDDDQFDAASVLGRIEQMPVPIPWDCLDGFEGAYWRRPHALLEPDAWRSMSALALIPEADRDAGMRRLRAELSGGVWKRRWPELFEIDELDLGYRVLLARP
jgi:hypothetical protein